MEAQKSSSPVVMIVFWLYVLIPLGWGVSNTISKAMDLFK